MYCMILSHSGTLMILWHANILHGTEPFWCGNVECDGCGVCAAMQIPRGHQDPSGGKMSPTPQKKP